MVKNAKKEIISTYVPGGPGYLSNKRGYQHSEFDPVWLHPK
jgi:hypothetical protein